ncbi:hypothetical protein P0R31_30200 [Bradyrhizobium yuanmingense]|uniref:hypothetical protein n=1 Tax=Bradyrhizobium yuanmingense TaxID=108015 RepID=UPI0023B9B6CA|nr:hypothetical protein [Bradyrhizobium yuanmingense]MDF0521524.1 hypothetical protein [Bradyrhizobium yuanmingense]
MPRIGSAAAYDDGLTPSGFLGRLSSGLQSIGNGGSILGAFGVSDNAGAAQPAPAIPMGDYSMPRIGGGDLYRQPTFGDRIGAGLHNFSSAGRLIPAIAGGIGGLATGRRFGAT